MPVETTKHAAPLQVARLAFSSFEHFAEAAGAWDLDWRQLDRGRLEASFFQVASAGAAISRVAFSRRFAQRGSSPSGMLTFGLIGKAVGEIGWCRQSVSAEDLLVFSSGGDNECVSRPGFRGHLVSFSEEHLEQIATDFELPLNLGPYREGGVALQIDPDEAADLRRRLRHLEHAVTKCSGDAGRRWIRHELEHEIPVRVLRLLAAGSPQTSLRVDGFTARPARMAREREIGTASRR